MPFQSWDAYHRYEHGVLYNLRYIHDQNVRDFLAAVRETSASRTRSLRAGTILWRAQLDHSYRLANREQPDEIEIPCASPPERMKPIPEKCKDGRVNPRGIACLYLATDTNTGCAEVRPWLGSYVSVAQFQTKRDLRIIDCTSVERRPLPFKSFDATDFNNPVVVPWGPEDYERLVWNDIGNAMSKPVAREDSNLDYVPTQIIAESLRDHGANGLAYKSLLGEGMNVALFDLKDADLIDCRLMETAEIRCMFKQIDGYTVKPK